MTEPTTRAGKRLPTTLRRAAAKPHILLRDLPSDWLHADILSIEAEARQQIYDLLASEEDPEHAMWTLHGIREAIDHLNEAD